MRRKPPPRAATGGLRAALSGPGRDKPDWLARALARAGVLPQPEAEVAIRAGRVSLEGRVVRQPLAPVPPGARVRLDGHPVSLAAPTRVLAFHKPAGVLTSHVGQHGAGTVYEVLLPQLPPALAGYTWHAVGRLDRGTTGLLLFTNDERLLAHVTAPASHLPKRYLATVQGSATGERLEALRRGVLLDDGPARPLSATARGPHAVEVVLSEGRHHQVKRMLGAVGLPVRALHREAVGRVALDLPPGGWRLLTPDEVAEGLGYPASPPP